MASFKSVMKAVSEVVLEAKLDVVDELVKYLSSRFEVDDDMLEMIDDFKKSLGETEVVKKTTVKKTVGKEKAVKTAGEEKKKRAPSVFNLYVKDVMPRMKTENPDVKNGRELMSLASEAWKTDPFAEYVKAKVMKMKKEDKDGDVVEMFEEAKRLYEEMNKVEEVDEVAEEQEDVVEEQEDVVKEQEDVVEVVVEKVKKGKKNKKVVEDNPIVKGKGKGKKA